MAKVKLNEHTMKTLPVPKDAAQAYYWDKEVTGFGVPLCQGSCRVVRT